MRRAVFGHFKVSGDHRFEGPARTDGCEHLFREVDGKLTAELREDVFDEKAPMAAHRAGFAKKLAAMVGAGQLRPAPECDLPEARGGDLPGDIMGEV